MTDSETIRTATPTEETSAVAPATESQVVPTQEETTPPSCPTCAGYGAMAPPSYVYALGRIEQRFQTLSVEKEMAQATGRAETAGLTDRQALHSVLSERRNRYLVRKLCWVLTIEGLETYILHPHDPADWDLLVDALRPTPRAGDIDAVIGVRGPIAPPDLCNGLSVPIVLFSQIYSFDVDSLIKSIPRPEGMTEEQFTPAAEELFGRIMQMADNAGATDEHRALNYVATRYHVIYATTADAHGRNSTLAAVEVRPSRLSGVRRIVNVILSFTNRQTDVVEKYFTRVDVTEEFAFLVTKCHRTMIVEAKLKGGSEMSTISIAGATANNMNMPRFTAESALSVTGRGYRCPACLEGGESWRHPVSRLPVTVAAELPGLPMTAEADLISGATNRRERAAVSVGPSLRTAG